MYMYIIKQDLSDSASFSLFLASTDVLSSLAASVSADNNLSSLFISISDQVSSSTEPEKGGMWRTYLLTNGVRRGSGVGSRDGGNDGAVGNTETRDVVDGKARVNDASLLAGQHSSRAARVHK